MIAWPSHEEQVADRYVPKSRPDQCKYCKFSWEKNDPIFLQIIFTNIVLHRLLNARGLGEHPA